MDKQKKRALLTLILEIPWLDILQTLLCIFKLTGIINIGWGWVLLPLWMFDGLYIVSLIFGFIHSKMAEDALQMQQEMYPMTEGSAASIEELKEINPELYDIIQNSNLNEQVQKTVEDEIEKQDKNSDNNEEIKEEV